MCTRAAQYGHLDVLQWARANGCPLNEMIRAVAAELGYTGED